MAKRRAKTATDQRPFVMVYHDMMESPLLENYYQKLVYIYLKKFADGSGQCFPSVKTLSQQTKISQNKIRQTLFELADLGLISVERRFRDDGGKTSNLYTLFDYKDVWQAETVEQAADVLNKYSDQMLIEMIEKRGYTVVKEKEPDYHPTKDDNQALKKDQFYLFNAIKNSEKSQEVAERYSMEDIKVLYDYEDALIVDPGKAEDYETVMGILYDTLNSNSDQIKVAGQNRPTMAVIGKLNKLTMEDILYAIEKFNATTERITNPRAYMLTILYNCQEQRKLDITNQVKHDMAHWNDEK